MAGLALETAGPKPPTSRRHEKAAPPKPRDAAPEPDSYVADLKALLSSDPDMYGCELGTNDSVLWKRISAFSSNAEHTGGKRSLEDFFRSGPLSSRNLRNILRSRSESPRRYRSAVRELQARRTRRPTPFGQPLSQTSSTGNSIDARQHPNASTSRINFMEERKREQQQRRSLERSRFGGLTYVPGGSRRHSRMKLSNSGITGPVQANALMDGIEKDYPHLVPKKTKTRHSRQMSASKLNAALDSVNTLHAADDSLLPEKPPMPPSAMPGHMLESESSARRLANVSPSPAYPSGVTGELSDYTLSPPPEPAPKKLLSRASSDALPRSRLLARSKAGCDPMPPMLPSLDKPLPLPTIFSDVPPLPPLSSLSLSSAQSRQGQAISDSTRNALLNLSTNTPQTKVAGCPTPPPTGPLPPLPSTAGSRTSWNNQQSANTEKLLTRRTSARSSRQPSPARPRIRESPAHYTCPSCHGDAAAAVAAGKIPSEWPQPPSGLGTDSTPRDYCAGLAHRDSIRLVEGARSRSRAGKRSSRGSELSRKEPLPTLAGTPTHVASSLDSKIDENRVPSSPPDRLPPPIPPRALRLSTRSSRSVDALRESAKENTLSAISTVAEQVPNTLAPTRLSSQSTLHLPYRSHGTQYSPPPAQPRQRRSHLDLSSLKWPLTPLEIGTKPLEPAGEMTPRQLPHVHPLSPPHSAGYNSNSDSGNGRASLKEKDWADTVESQLGHSNSTNTVAANNRSSTALIRDLEQRMEHRLAACERMNFLLKMALMGIIEGSAGVDTLVGENSLLAMDLSPSSGRGHSILRE